MVPPGWGGSLGAAVAGGAVTWALGATVKAGLDDDFAVVAVGLTALDAFTVVVVPETAPGDVVAVPLSAIEVAVVVAGFATALALARATDLVATVPERHTGNLRDGMHGFSLPVATPEFTVSMLWHPRMHADPAHRWLRGCVRDVCAQED